MRTHRALSPAGKQLLTQTIADAAADKTVTPADLRETILPVARQLKVPDGQLGAFVESTVRALDDGTRIDPEAQRMLATAAKAFELGNGLMLGASIDDPSPRQYRLQLLAHDLRDLVAPDGAKQGPFWRDAATGQVLRADQILDRLSTGSGSVEVDLSLPVKTKRQHWWSTAEGAPELVVAPPKHHTLHNLDELQSLVDAVRERTQRVRRGEDFGD
ncbi:MAG: hypothetical protein IPJ65_19540 [Archangiaceae bacterium]|nr:hypothetical protein [Archangiaceae bacterium]